MLSARFNGCDRIVKTVIDYAAGSLISDALLLVIVRLFNALLLPFESLHGWLRPHVLLAHEVRELDMCRLPVSLLRAAAHW